MPCPGSSHGWRREIASKVVLLFTRTYSLMTYVRTSPTTQKHRHISSSTVTLLVNSGLLIASTSTTPSVAPGCTICLTMRNYPRRPSLVPTFVALCCWYLWKRRNDYIFLNESNSVVTTLRACLADARLWAYRLPASDSTQSSSWRTALSLAISSL